MYIFGKSAVIVHLKLLPVRLSQEENATDHLLHVRVIIKEALWVD